MTPGGERACWAKANNPWIRLYALEAFPDAAPPELGGALAAEARTILERVDRLAKK